MQCHCVDNVLHFDYLIPTCSNNILLNGRPYIQLIILGYVRLLALESVRAGSIQAPAPSVAVEFFLFFFGVGVGVGLEELKMHVDVEWFGEQGECNEWVSGVCGTLLSLFYVSQWLPIQSLAPSQNPCLLL